MANVLVNETSLQDIADAIRDKLSVETTYKPSEMAAAIETIGGGVTPTGTKQISITENGTTTEDVTSYANAEITVNVSGGGGGDSSNGILDGSISGAYSNADITTLRNHALNGCSALTSVSFPNVTTVGTNALYNCNNVTSISFPKLASTGVYSFSGMTKLTSISLPALASVLTNFTFSGDTALTIADIGSGCGGLGGQTFGGCSALKTVILRSSSVASCSNNTFNGTPFASGGTGGTVYVPSNLISSYQTASNWSTLYNAGTCVFAAIEGSQYE